MHAGGENRGLGTSRISTIDGSRNVLLNLTQADEVPLYVASEHIVHFSPKRDGEGGEAARAASTTIMLSTGKAVYVRDAAGVIADKIAGKAVDE